MPPIDPRDPRMNELAGQTESQIGSSLQTRGLRRLFDRPQAAYFIVACPKSGTTWLQRRTRSDMLGRVMSLIMLASLGLTPIGLSLAGLVVQAHVTLLFLVAGTVILAAAAAASASRTVRQM